MNNTTFCLGLDPMNSSELDNENLFGVPTPKGKHVPQKLPATPARAKIFFLLDI